VTSAPAERLLTLDEVCERLRCSRRTLARRKELPRVVDGGLVRVRESDLERYLLSRLHIETPGDGNAVAVAAGSVLKPGSRLWE
jgi:excisionase family DNA binding protein